MGQFRASWRRRARGGRGQRACSAPTQPDRAPALPGPREGGRCGAFPASRSACGGRWSALIPLLVQPLDRGGRARTRSPAILRAAGALIDRSRSKLRRLAPLPPAYYDPPGVALEGMCLGPVLAIQALPPARRTGPASTAIVLDTSLSMRSSESPPRFSAGREKLRRDAAQGLSARGAATVLLVRGRGRGAEPASAPVFDRVRLRAPPMIDEAKPGYQGADVRRWPGAGGRARWRIAPSGASGWCVLGHDGPSAFRLRSRPPQVRARPGACAAWRWFGDAAGTGARCCPTGCVDLRLRARAQSGPARVSSFTSTVSELHP